MNQKKFIYSIVIALVIVLVGVGSYFVFSQNINKEAPSSISFKLLQRPTPSSVGCTSYTETYSKTRQGKIIQTYTEWKGLYGNCYTETDIAKVIDFDKETMIAVFAGPSCEAAKIEVDKIVPKNGKLVVHSRVTAGICSLPSFIYPFTLVVIDKNNFAAESAEFTFDTEAP